VISDVERLQLENEALLNVLQKFAKIRTENAYIADLVAGTRIVLQSIAARRKAVRSKEEERIEQTCFNIVNQCMQVHIDEPFLVLERNGSRDWSALLDGHVESVGVGDGTTALGALQLLYARVKSYRQRLERGMESWHPDRSWNTCQRQNCRGPVEAENGSTKFVDGGDAVCIECGAVYIVSLFTGGGHLHRNRRRKTIGT
jgi:hypothetical protein